MSFELNLPIPIHFIHWFLKYQCSLLPSPAWPCPVYLGSWTQHPRFLCNIALYSIRLDFCHETHPQLSRVFTLAQLLHFYWHACVFSCFSRVWLPVTLWTVARQAPLSMGFSWQEYWSGLPFPSAVDHVLSELFTLTGPSWVVLPSMAHGFSGARPFAMTRLWFMKEI